MSRRSVPRWYGFMASWSGAKGVAQIDSPIVQAERVARRSMELPEPILRLAQDEYDRRFPGQPYERMQERGGLGLLEIIALLADRIGRTERERASEVSEWRQAQAAYAAPDGGRAEQVRFPNE